MKEICKQGYEVDELVSMLRSMLRIRMAEEQIGELVKKREIICPAHLSVGQEAIAVGVCSALTNNDYLFSTHRAHGHYLAKGGNLKAMMAEMFGRKTGCSGGRGGSMHLVQPDIGIMGTTSIVGGCFPIAVGAGLSLKLRDEKNISVVFFGDGAMDEGVFFESLNFAAIHKLPVLFVCENNYYATHMRICRRIRCDRQVNNLQQYEVCECDQLIKRVEAFNVPAKRVYGNDPVEVNKTARFMIDYIRSGQGPYFLDCLTYRWRGHVGPNWDVDMGLRSQVEIDGWMKKCPIANLELQLKDMLDDSTKHKLYADIKTEIEEAIKYALQSPMPDLNSVLEHVYKESH